MFFQYLIFAAIPLGFVSAVVYGATGYHPFFWVKPSPKELAIENFAVSLMSGGAKNFTLDGSETIQHISSDDIEIKYNYHYRYSDSASIIIKGVKHNFYRRRSVLKVSKILRELTRERNAKRESEELEEFYEAAHLAISPIEKDTTLPKIILVPERNRI